MDDVRALERLARMFRYHHENSVAQRRALTVAEASKLGEVSWRADVWELAARLVENELAALLAQRAQPRVKFDGDVEEHITRLDAVAERLRAAHFADEDTTLKADVLAWKDEARYVVQHVKDRDEVIAALTAERDRLGRLVPACTRLVEVIEAAGVYNLMNGVQLGQMSWAVKCEDALRWVKNTLAADEEPA